MHTYDTRQKENMCTNPSIHCFAGKCVRSQLPIVLNNTPLRILQKIYVYFWVGCIINTKLPFCVDIISRTSLGFPSWCPESTRPTDSCFQGTSCENLMM